MKMLLRTAACVLPVYVLAVLMCLPALGAGEMENGNFEDFPGSTIANKWTGAYSATVANQFLKETTTVHTSPGIAQRIKSKDTSGSWCHIYTTDGIDTREGDALTIRGWLWVLSAANYTLPQIGINSTSARPSTWLYQLTSYTKQTWISTGSIACNTGPGDKTYVFLETKRNLNAGDTTIIWDDFVTYHAYRPPAPTVSNRTASTIDVDVNPGGNAGNPNAQFAISIGGGGFVLGTHWVLSDGSVGTAADWLTDVLWGNKTVTGLSEGVNYEFQVMARYSSTLPQATFLGDTGVIPEPGGILVLASGLPVCAFFVRRRK